MSRLSRLASSVPVVVLWLLALDGVVPLAGSQDPPPTAPPPAQPAGQPPATVRPRMREHFGKGAEMRDAVIKADLAAVKAPATWLAEHPQDDLPAAAQPNVREMQKLAADVAAAPDLPQAAQSVARLAASCGRCHIAVNVTPTLMASIPKREDGTLPGHMRKHYRAADLLYRGLVVPSEYSWSSGAKALTGDPVELELRKGAAPAPEIEALAKRLHGLAEEAAKAEDLDARTSLYGRMLETCSDCHKRQNVKIR